MTKCHEDGGRRLERSAEARRACDECHGTAGEAAGVTASSTVTSESRRLHMIGNAHIDPVWLWQWQEGYQEVRATFQSAVDRLDEYPDFVFTCDSSLFFEWVEESDPALFEQIRARVAEGRFQVVGGWWVEPDCNIPCGESFVRQALYGQRYLREKLGVTASVGANLDSFGHNATIPQILAGSGCDAYVFLRPGPKEKQLESPVFWWESPDGSRVLAYRIPHEYCAPKDDLGGHVEAAVASLPDGEREWAVFYGVGNHGGGPTKANLDQIRALNEEGRLPRLEPSSLRAFFDGLAEDGGHPGRPRRAAAPRAGLLHDPLGDQALEPPRREPAPARREVGGGRGAPRPPAAIRTRS